MAVIEITLGLLLAVAAVAAIGKWVPLPLPLLLVTGGIAFSYGPGFREVSIEPEVFFLLFIPPLLFADGWMNRRKNTSGSIDTSRNPGPYERAMPPVTSSSGNGNGT